jgi:hypothetical protein
VPEVKARFKQDWPVPALHSPVKDWKMVAPPISSRPALLGTAFDYVLRFHLQRLNRLPMLAKRGCRRCVRRMKSPMLEVGREICAIARERLKAF